MEEDAVAHRVEEHVPPVGLHDHARSQEPGNLRVPGAAGGGARVDPRREDHHRIRTVPIGGVDAQVEETGIALGQGNAAARGQHGEGGGALGGQATGQGQQEEEEGDAPHVR